MAKNIQNCYAIVHRFGTAGRGAKYDLFIQSLNQSFLEEMLSEPTHENGERKLRNVRSFHFLNTQYPFVN